MVLPVSVEEARAQLRADSEDQDEEINDFIRDAADWVEGYTGQILEARDVHEYFSGFRPVALRAWPIAPNAVPVVSYIGSDGQPVIVNGVRLTAINRPARVGSSLGPFWPFVDSKQTFKVTVRAGYESPNDVPRSLCRAMLVLIGAYDADREGGDILAKAEETARRLCRRLKRHTL